MAMKLSDASINNLMINETFSQSSFTFLKIIKIPYGDKDYFFYNFSICCINMHVCEQTAFPCYIMYILIK